MKSWLRRLSAVCMALLLAFTACITVCAQEPAPFAESAYDTQGDYTLHYRQFPAKTAQPKGRILLLHGFIASTVFWEPLTAYYTSAGYDCVLVDLPGFGYSTRERADMNAVSREALLAGLMQTLAPGERWIVGGHSMGGGVALNLAAMYPDSVESLMLFAPAEAAAFDQQSFFGKVLSGRLGSVLACLMDIMFRAALPICEWKPIAAVIIRSQGYDSGYDIKRYSQPLKLDGTGGSLVYMMQRVTPFDEAAIAALECPILLLWGSEDKIITGSAKKEIERLLPDQTVIHTLDGATHVFPEAGAEEAAALSLSFLG